MANLLAEFSVLGINVDSLTDKKQQTDYKIKYVTEYVKQWAIISAERKDISNLVFVDCMCNAGVYKDGDLCTAMEVLLLFIKMSSQHPDKIFNLYINDYDNKKIDVLKKVIHHLGSSPIPNLKINLRNDDVNDYLIWANNESQIFEYGNSIILYVDPYDFGTVYIDKIVDILKSNYCELLFNVFTSDYRRNRKHDAGRINACVGRNDLETDNEVITYIKDRFHVGKIQYSFAYRFKTKTNIELYEILFATPNLRGLEVLKEALWQVFDGKEFHRNEDETGQLTLFTPDEEKEYRIKQYASEAKDLLLENKSRELAYKEIEQFLIENTMLKDSHLLSRVVKPLIEDGKLVKLGKVPKNNYKGDTYRIEDHNEKENSYL